MDESPSRDGEFRLVKRVDFPHAFALDMVNISKFIMNMNRDDPEALNKLYDMLSNHEDKLEYHSVKNKAESLVKLQEISKHMIGMDAYDDTDKFRLELTKYRKLIIKVAGESGLLIAEMERAKKHRR